MKAEKLLQKEWKSRQSAKPRPPPAFPLLYHEVCQKVEFFPFSVPHGLWLDEVCKEDQ